MSKALLVVDVQNDYFEGGAFPLWNTNEVLENIKDAIKKCNEKNIHVVLIQHVADKSRGPAPFFNKGTDGVQIHEDIQDITKDSKVVIKTFADGFCKTNLEEILDELNVDELVVCGMMTQNCVTHTAISKTAEKYKEVKVLADCCTTTDEMIHLVALDAISTRVGIASFNDAI